MPPFGFSIVFPKRGKIFQASKKLPALPKTAICRKLFSLNSYPGHAVRRCIYAPILRLCIKVINIINNICTKKHKTGDFFVDIFGRLSTKPIFIHNFDTNSRAALQGRAGREAEMKVRQSAPASAGLRSGQ
jgi:hypothetical protein